MELESKWREEYGDCRNTPNDSPKTIDTVLHVRQVIRRHIERGNGVSPEDWNLQVGLRDSKSLQKFLRLQEGEYTYHWKLSANQVKNILFKTNWPRKLAWGAEKLTTSSAIFQPLKKINMILSGCKEKIILWST